MTTRMDPIALSRALRQRFQPTQQQAQVIGAEPGPLLVVAGAGAGKTETMAARVVWLVANGYARPDQVLGLTFTRKAARELEQRIRDRLGVLAADRNLVYRLDPSGALVDGLAAIAPTVSTYDAYAGDLIREYGLLVPVEPDARLITAAELHAIASDVVTDYTGKLIPDEGNNPAPNTVVDNVLGLMTSMGNELATPFDVRTDAQTFLRESASLERSSRSKVEYSQKLAGWRNKQQERIDYLPLAQELKQELRRRGVVTFNEQMSVAAAMARDHRAVGEGQRRRFKVVMLDEYQDTSHAQRVLLRSLFGGSHDAGLTVTAVGDPMQAIYTWRGATAANLEAFVEDFPVPGGEPAPKLELTTSWRNPPEVLQLANTISDDILGTATTRAVARLEARPDAPQGQVSLGFFDTDADEIAYVADELATKFHHAQHTEVPFNAAVLVRKNRHSAQVAEALEARGVPYEIVGVAGLLDVPEVADVVAIATMLVRPADSAAALRILGGAAVGLGLADLAALAQRAENLRGGDLVSEADTSADAHSRDEPTTHAQDVLERDLEMLLERAGEVTERVERAAGLTDAVADLGEPERYSPEGLRRLRDLAARLRWLRTHSLGKRLSDLFSDIISVFGIRTAVLARRSVSRAVHLDKLLEEVDAYPGASVEGLLDYFALARKHEEGLTPGTVVAKNDRVQILTAHKAKGLEWDTVAVVHADARTYDVRAETFLSYVPVLQDEMFGDPERTPAFAEVETRTDFQKAAEAWVKTVRAELAEETTRLFYVAITRAAQTLIVTAARTQAGSDRVAVPYRHFEAMRELVEPSCVVHWAGDATDAAFDADDGDASEVHAVEKRDDARHGLWPDLDPPEEQAAAAVAVSQALEMLPSLVDGELYGLWERDVSALIEEHTASLIAEVPVVLPGELTASDVVAIQADPEQFARRVRRPVPFKPNAYAKRGTAFHEWLEEFYGQRPLLTEDELPGIDEAEVDMATLEQLKANFTLSEWARRTPRYVEHPFELALGESVIRGRIDAVFEDANGWTVVDWKTGQRPGKAEMQSAKLQLAVYKEAWKRIADDGRKVDAVFFYVRTGQNVAPENLPSGDELRTLLHASASGSSIEAGQSNLSLGKRHATAAGKNRDERRTR